MSTLHVHNLDLHQGQRSLCQGLQLAIESGQAWLVLGENGAGKSTLLATLAGWLSSPAGSVALNGQSLASWPAQARARQLAWLPQSDDCAFPVTVLEKVLSGRYPHRRHWTWAQAEDPTIAQAALARVDLAQLADRPFPTLSGGEKRRAALAAVLAQQTPLLLLDEPLSQLDLRHQQQILRLLAAEREAGRGLLVVGHEPNHARAFASHVLLLYGDGRWQAGPVAEVLTADNLSAVYRYPVRQLAGGHWYAAD